MPRMRIREEKLFYMNRIRRIGMTKRNAEF